MSSIQSLRAEVERLRAAVELPSTDPEGFGILYAELLTAEREVSAARALAAEAEAEAADPALHARQMSRRWARDAERYAEAGRWDKAAEAFAAAGRWAATAARNGRA